MTAGRQATSELLSHRASRVNRERFGRAGGTKAIASTPPATPAADAAPVKQRDGAHAFGPAIFRRNKGFDCPVYFRLIPFWDAAQGTQCERGVGCAYKGMGAAVGAGVWVATGMCVACEVSVVS
jgi:hypothetical protein